MGRKQQRRLNFLADNKNCYFCEVEISNENASISWIQFDNEEGRKKIALCAACVIHRQSVLNYGCTKNRRITKNVRMKIWQNHPYCKYCGVALTYEQMTLDHVLPRSKGGRNAQYNLVPACSKCNIEKGNKYEK